VYNRALSAEEIRNRFSVPTSPAASLDPQVERSVIVSWPFDDVQQRIELGLTQAGPREPYRSRLAGNATSALLRPEKAPAATEMERPASSLTAPTVATAPHAKEPLLTQAVRLAGPATEPPGSLFLSRGDRIVAFGDSITYAGGYLRYIDALLSEQFAEFEIPQIINKGIGGQKAENLVARFQKDVLDIKPAVVLISIGINDVWHRLKSPHDETVLHAYERNLRKMVDMAQAAGIKVVLLTPTIIMEDRMAEGNLRLLQYDLAMREIALEKQCRVANLHTLFLNALRQKPREMSANCLTSDGVHMKPLGNAIMALGVLRALGIPEEKIARATWSDPQ
jgi:lysophospholipase L1-like esterase